VSGRSARVKRASDANGVSDAVIKTPQGVRRQGIISKYGIREDLSSTAFQKTSVGKSKDRANGNDSCPTAAANDGGGKHEQPHPCRLGQKVGMNSAFQLG